MTVRKKLMIVGAGPQAIRIAAQLLHCALYSLDEIVLIDPNLTPLSRLAEYFRDCGTVHLRSGATEHVHPDDEHLRTFCQGRAGAFARGDRPCVDAWLEHAAAVVQEFELSHALKQGWVNSFERSNEGIHVWTSAGEYLVDRLIIATGQSRPFYPEWGARLRGHDPRICSIFDNDFEGSELPRTNNPVVVGSGITAAQVVDVLFAQGAETVTLLTRRKLSRGEGRTSSMHWREEQLRGKLCALRTPDERDAMLRAEGDRGTMPSWEIERLEQLLNENRLEHRICEIAHVEPTLSDGVHIHTERSTEAIQTGLLVMCTGFVSEMQDWLKRSARRNELPLYPDGSPLLTPQFEWGEDSGIFLTGHFAKRVAGPFAHNVIGGIIVADCLCKQLVH